MTFVQYSNKCLTFLEYSLNIIIIHRDIDRLTRIDKTLFQSSAVQSIYIQHRISTSPSPPPAPPPLERRLPCECIHTMQIQHISHAQVDCEFASYIRLKTSRVSLCLNELFCIPNYFITKPTFRQIVCMKFAYILHLFDIFPFACSPTLPLTFGFVSFSRSIARSFFISFVRLRSVSFLSSVRSNIRRSFIRLISTTAIRFGSHFSHSVHSFSNLKSQ